MDLGPEKRWRIRKPPAPKHHWLTLRGTLTASRRDLYAPQRSLVEKDLQQATGKLVKGSAWGSTIHRSLYSHRFNRRSQRALRAQHKRIESSPKKKTQKMFSILRYHANSGSWDSHKATAIAWHTSWHFTFPRLFVSIQGIRHKNSA